MFSDKFLTGKEHKKHAELVDNIDTLVDDILAKNKGSFSDAKAENKHPSDEFFRNGINKNPIRIVKNKLPVRKILAVVLTLILIFVIIPASLPYLYGDFGSDVSISLVPQNVHDGDLVFINVTIPSSYNIRSVNADMGGIETIELSLIDNSTENQLWQATWIVHDAKPGDYFTTIKAVDEKGTPYSSMIDWSVSSLDDVVNETRGAARTGTPIMGNESSNGTTPPANTVASSDLYIWDDTDYQKRYVNDTITFYANYSSFNQSIENATCLISFNEGGWTEPAVMNYNDGLYLYSRFFVKSGIYEYGVTCSAVGYENRTMLSDCEVFRGETGNNMTLPKPQLPTSFFATTYDQAQIDLSWAKGVGANNTYIVRKIGSYPIDRTDGTIVYNGTGTSYSDTGLSQSTQYYYRAWSFAQGVINGTIFCQWSDYYTSANAKTKTNIPTKIYDNFWEEGGYGTISGVTMNYAKAWNYLLGHTTWNLQADVGSQWKNVGSLSIDYRDASENKKKISLIFDANTSAQKTNYRMNLTVDSVLDDYFFDDSNHIIRLTYMAFGHQFLFTFNYSDIASLPNIIITKGIAGNKFWFCVQYDGVIRGTHVVLDPEYTIATSASATATAYNNGRKLARTSDGTLYAVYLKPVGAGSIDNVFYAKSTDNGSTWTGETQLTSFSTYHAGSPSIAVDSSDSVNVVYAGRQNSGTYRLNYTKLTGSGSMSVPVDIGTGNYAQYCPAIAVDSNDKIHVTWSGCYSGSTTCNQIFYRNSSGSWGTPIKYITKRAVNDQHNPSIAINYTNGNIYVVWYGNYSGSTTNYQIRFSKSTDGGTTWPATPVNITGINGGTYYDQQYPSMALDNKYLYVVWNGKHSGSGAFYQIRFSRSANGGTSWTNPSNITAPLNYAQYNPSIALGGAVLYAVWHGFNTTVGGSDKQIRFSTSTNGGTSWTKPGNLTSGGNLWRHYPNLIWAPYPIIRGVRIDLTRAGFAFVFTNYSEAHFNRSAKLAWYTPPTLSNPGPTNQSTGPGRRYSCNITVSDIDGGTVTVKFFENTTGKTKWVLRQTSSSSVSSPANVVWIYNQAKTNKTKYWWAVNVSDSQGGYDNETFYFTTGPPWIVKEDTGASGTSITYNNQRKLARTSDGTLYCVYNRTCNGNSEIMCAKSTTAGENWTEHQITTGSSYDQSHPSIAVDSNDYLHVVWDGSYSAFVYNRIRYSGSTDGGVTWSAIKNITQSAPQQYQYYPSIAVDSEDTLHVVWYGKYSLAAPGSSYQIRYSNATTSKGSGPAQRTWLPIQNISNIARNQYNPSIAIDSSDNLHIVFYGTYSGLSPGSYYQIRCSNISHGAKIGVATWPINITNIAYNQYYPSIAVDNNNKLHVVWNGTSSGSAPGSYNQVRYSNSAEGIKWSAPINISRQIVDQCNPSISVLAGSNALNVAWCGVPNSIVSIGPQLRLSSYTGGSWTWPINLTNDNLHDYYYSNLIWAKDPGVTNSLAKGYAFLYCEEATIKYYNSTDLAWAYLSCNVTPWRWDQGHRNIGVGQFNKTLNVNFTLTNNGNVAIDILINATNATTAGGTKWLLKRSPGLDMFNLSYQQELTLSWTFIYPSFNTTFITGLGAGSNKRFGLKMYFANASSTGDPMFFTVTFKSVIA